MASSYSTDLKLELMVTGENAGTWGDKTNTNLNLVQQAIAGVESITLTDGGTKALAMSDAALSDARNMVLKIATITLSSASNLTIPDGIEKFYILDATAVTNPTNLTFKTASGTGFTLDAAKIYAAYADGTNITEVSLDTLGGTIGSAQIADNAVVTAKISNANVTTAKIADNAITTAKISALQVTQAKIANDAVGPDQLSNTAVTAGSYTTANITVDAQGRLTAASSGAGGDGAFAPRLMLQGPASGNYTSPSGANRFYAYAIGGGGGGGGGRTNNAEGGSGGAGAAGFYAGTLQGNTTYAYTIGAGGPGNVASQNNRGDPGQDGSDTNLGSLFTAPGGERGTGAGNVESPGPAGQDGDTSNAEFVLLDNYFGFPDPYPGSGGPGGVGGFTQQPGTPGTAGFLMVYDNGET